MFLSESYFLSAISSKPLFKQGGSLGREGSSWDEMKTRIVKSFPYSISDSYSNRKSLNIMHCSGKHVLTSTLCGMGRQVGPFIDGTDYPA